MATLEQKLDLSSQQKELVAVGASVGAGCHPCVSHHLNAGTDAGLEDEQLLAAVVSAERVSAEAAVLMGDHVRGTLGPEVTPALLTRSEETLAALGAALGANDKTNIERQLKAAIELGVSRGQLHEAIETARIVQENATRIHVREAERLLDSLDVVGSQVSEGDLGGCGAANNEHAAASEEPPTTEPAAETSAGCGPAAGETGPGGFAAMMAAFCAPSGGPDAMTGPAAAMAKCRGMFERGSDPASAATPVETPAAPESAGSCGGGADDDDRDGALLGRPHLRPHLVRP
jgi:AhpD family alkylhydroperoxidase